MKAWLFQDHRQREKLGEACPWYVGWFDSDGKKRSKRVGSRSQAEKYQRKIEGQLAAGLYQTTHRKTWADFCAEYEAKILPTLEPSTQRVASNALAHFTRLMKPARVDAIKTQTVDEFIARRRIEPGKKRGALVSAATLNKELRHLKAALGVAADWGYLAKVPKFRMVREPEKIGRVISPEHFQAIYEACDQARRPAGQGWSPVDWWRALMVFAISTGWRIEEILSLRREDLDLETGRVVTRHADNKAKRDEADFVPAVALEHLRRIAAFTPSVFYWPHSNEALYSEFQAIQKAAGIHLACPDAGEHECTPRCHLYGFHAFRRGYATLNADHLPAPVLQKKMRHRSFTTTQRYIALAEKMKAAAEKVRLPAFLEARRQA